MVKALRRGFGDSPPRHVATYKHTHTHTHTMTNSLQYQRRHTM